MRADDEAMNENQRHADETEEDDEASEAQAIPGSNTIVLFFFDVLGFSERVREIGLGRILAQYEALVDLIKARAGGRLVITTAPVDDKGTMAPIGGYIDLKSAYFSDTILLWTEYDPIRFQTSVDFVLDFFCDCFRNGLPLRGAIAFGDAVMDTSRGIFLGEPIIEAARAEAAQQWSGCTFAPSLDRFPHLGPVDRFMPYESQIKSGRAEFVRGLALDWPRRWVKNYPNDDLRTIINNYRRSGFDKYWDTTEQFIEHCSSNKTWWTTLP